MRPRGLKPVAGGKKIPKRVGKDTGLGLGRNAGKSGKGQGVGSGGEVRPGFGGGQMPLYRKLPKRGFTNIFAGQYVSINVDRLNISENGAEVILEVLLKRRVINKIKDGVETLGNGILEKSLTVKGCKLSKSAAEKIEAAGGKIEVI